MFRFPFTNFHELNLDWILSVVKEAKAVFDSGREDIDYAVATADEAKEIAQQAAEATVPDNSVTTPKIRDNAVTTPKIATYAVTTDKIQEGGVTASKIAQGLLCNPNLLDNWFFVGGSTQIDGNFPINQRGQTIYNNSGNFIDRWKATQLNSGVINVQNDGLQIQTSSTAAGAVIVDQILDTPTYNMLKGRTITCSVLVSEITGKFSLQCCGSAVQITQAGLITLTQNVPSDYTFNFGIRIYNAANTGDSSITIKAVKLELGANQTLAHQENGMWVLNELPNYCEQLEKCQRYLMTLRGGTLRYNSTQITSSLIDFTIPLPCTMQYAGRTPTLIGGDFVLYPVNPSTGAMQSADPDFTFNIDIMGTNALGVRATKTSHGLTRAILGISGNALISVES